MSFEVKPEKHLAASSPLRQPSSNVKNETILGVAQPTINSLGSASNLPQSRERLISIEPVSQEMRLDCPSQADLIRVLTSSGISETRATEITKNIDTTLNQAIQQTQERRDTYKVSTFPYGRYAKILEKLRSAFVPCILTDTMNYLSDEEYSKLIVLFKEQLSNTQLKDTIFSKVMTNAVRNTRTGIVKELLKMKIPQCDINDYFIHVGSGSLKSGSPKIIECFYGRTTVNFQKNIDFPPATYIKPVRKSPQILNRALALIKVQLKQEELEDAEIQSIVDKILKNIEKLLNFCPSFNCTSQCLVAGFGSADALKKMYEKSNDLHSPPPSDKCIYPVGFAMKFRNFDTLELLINNFFASKTT